MGTGKLDGQVALVTGASSGIGAALAGQLAAHGADLVITARRVDRLEAVAAKLTADHGVTVHCVALDLGQPGGAVQLVERCGDLGVTIDVLVNNAGFGHYDDFLAIDWERHAAMLQLNVVALTELTRLLVPGMLERGRGRVMNLSAFAAWTALPSFAVYAATKAYVRNFTEALDYELKKTGVRAIAVCPGGVTTEFSDASGQALKKRAQAAMMSADRCARIAVKKMLRGRRTVIPGFLNTAVAWCFRWIPRTWHPGIAHRIMRAGVDKANP